ncbi:MAG: hypothetical protein Q8Q74_04350, partial [Polaromonas sp.]|nr:hypothetical protein [Polaromonas sp.]
MESPIDMFLEWYRSIPVSHRQDIAGIVGMSLPGYEAIGLIEPLDASIQKFMNITEAFRGQGYKEIAAVIALRGFIQFFFIDRRSDRSGWRETEAMLKALAASKNSETFEKASREVQFRSEQWLVTCEKWERLVAE